MGGGISNSQIITEEGKYALDTTQNNPDIEGSLRNETDKLSEKINIINSREYLSLHLAGIDSNSMQFTINFSRTGQYRFPIIIYVASQSGYYTTIYGAILYSNNVVFSDNDKVAQITTTNISDTEIKVNITFKNINLWGRAIVLTWGGEISFSY